MTGSARAPRGAAGGACRSSRRREGTRRPEWVNPYRRVRAAGRRARGAGAFIRYSTPAARNLTGTEALTTYALAQRLSKQKRYAYLRPHVADMRRALGKQRKPKPEEKPEAKVAEVAPETEQQ